MIRFAFPAEPFAVRGALKSVVGIMRRQGIPSEQAESAHLVLAEVLNNIAEHAYVGLEPGEADLQMAFRTGSIDFIVCDRGVKPPANLLGRRRMPDSGGPLADLPEGGFGWPLVGCLATGLRQDRRNGENRLRFSIPPCPEAKGGD